MVPARSSSLGDGLSPYRISATAARRRPERLTCYSEVEPTQPCKPLSRRAPGRDTRRVIPLKYAVLRIHDSSFPSQLASCFEYEPLPSSPAHRREGANDFGVRRTYCAPSPDFLIKPVSACVRCTSCQSALRSAAQPGQPALALYSLTESARPFHAE